MSKAIHEAAVNSPDFETTCRQIVYAERRVSTAQTEHAAAPTAFTARLLAVAKDCVVLYTDAAHHGLRDLGVTSRVDRQLAICTKTRALRGSI